MPRRRTISRATGRAYGTPQWTSAPVACATSVDHGPCDGRRFTSGDEPAGCGGEERHSDDREREVEEGHVAQVPEVVVPQRHQDDVGARDGEDRAEESECTGGGGRQGAADTGGRA